MGTRQETIDNLLRCYGSIETLTADLDEAEWSAPSLCPDWDTRGVVGHLAGVEYALSGWRPQGPDTMPPFERVGDFTAEAAEMSDQRFAERVGEVLRSRSEDLLTLDDGDFETMTGSPVGPVAYRRFMDVRVFDFWVHERDITTPLGRQTDDSGPAAETALDEIESAIGYIVGKGIGLPEGSTIRFDVTGPATRVIDVAVDARAAKVDHLDDPDVVLSADTVTFVQLACGRIDPDEAIDQVRVQWKGDDEWGARAARGLRFTR